MKFREKNKILREEIERLSVENRILKEALERMRRRKVAEVIISVKEIIGDSKAKISASDAEEFERMWEHFCKMYIDPLQEG